MNMKQVTYWEAQENRWHEKYMEAEKLIDQLEVKIWEKSSKIEFLQDALREVAKFNSKRDRFSNQIDGIVINALGENDV